MVDFSICVFNEDPYGYDYCYTDVLIDHVKRTRPDEIQTRIIPTATLYWAVEPSLTEDWVEDILSHIERLSKVDIRYPPLIYNTQVVDGVHRIVWAYINNIPELEVKIIPHLPPLQYRLKNPMWDSVNRYYLNTYIQFEAFNGR